MGRLLLLQYLHGAVTWTFDPATGLELRKPDADNTTELKACDAENRPTDFTSQAADGTITTVHCEYDHMGRRAIKRVMVNGNVTLHQRYIYRGYLQIACIDLTRSHHPALWYITWDPTQPIATRPLALQKDATWYTCGWGKRIMEWNGAFAYGVLASRACARALLFVML